MTAWHALELQVLREQLTPQGCTLLAPYAIGEQPLEIDAVVRSVRLFEHQKRTLWLLVHLFRKHTLLEIKSVAEAFNVPKFQKFLGYSHLYLWKEELSEEDLAAVALVTHVPGQLLASRKWKRLGKGFYQLAHDFFVSLVAVNELPIRREYYPLLLLASGQQQERFLRAILQGGDIYYLQYALLANSEEMFRMSEELNLSLPRSLEENLRFLIEKGIFNPRKVAQELVAGAGVQPIVDAVGVDTLADSLDEVKTRQMLQRLLSKVDRDTLRQLLENPSLQNSQAEGETAPISRSGLDPSQAQDDIAKVH